MREEELEPILAKAREGMNEMALLVILHFSRKFFLPLEPHMGVTELI